MKISIAFILLLLSFNSMAVVKRHDIPPESYELKETPSFYIDMPHEGAGILIDKYWVLSAAHVIFYDYDDKPILIQGVENRIEKLVFHPEFQQDPGEWGHGDAKPLIDFLKKRSDIVLLKLAKPVEHLKPIGRYYGNEEVGMKITVYGKGATGTGLTGAILDTKQPSLWEKFINAIKSPFSDFDETQENRVLNHYHNIIESLDDNWLRFRFDETDKALQLEGSVGSGDSGGPSIIINNGIPLLVGITSWTDYDGDLKDFVGGKYNSIAVLVRVSAYNNWIDKVIAHHENKT